MPVPVPSVVFDPETNGLTAVPQHTPRAVTADPPSAVTLPPPLAVVPVIALTAVVDATVGAVITVTVTALVTLKLPASVIVTWNAYVPAFVNVAVLDFAAFVPLALNVTDAGGVPVVAHV